MKANVYRDSLHCYILPSFDGGPLVTMATGT